MGIAILRPDSSSQGRGGEMRNAGWWQMVLLLVAFAALIIIAPDL